jgi:hypothetical protein
VRKIIYWVHASIDGFIDGPNGEFGRKLFAEPKQRLNLRTGQSRLLDGNVVVTSYEPAK